jgi:hypothetical protein
MNLQQTQVIQSLKEPPKKTVVQKKRSKLQVARRVFQLAAQGGFPYTGMTAEQWAKKWLPSKEFILCEVNIHAAASINTNVVASPHPPKNPNRVNHYLQCSVDAMDPIVVDLNRQRVGRSYLGYIPEIVVLDGKHRKKAQLQQGRIKILAWVGASALKLMPEITVRIINASKEKCTLPPLNPLLREGRKNATYELFAETSNASKSVDGRVLYTATSNASRRKPKDCKACGARSSGTLEDDSSNSDKKVPPDASDDGSSVEASDRLKWNPNKPNMNAPGTKGWNNEQRGFNNPISDAPGAGVGPRLKPDKGASRSEMARSVAAGGPGSGRRPDGVLREKGWKRTTPDSAPGKEPTSFYKHPDMPGHTVKVQRDSWSHSDVSGRLGKGSGGDSLASHLGYKSNTGLAAKGKVVKEMFEDDDVDAVAPPGRENQVLGLKKKFGSDSSAPFKIAWDQHNKGK